MREDSSLSRLDRVFISYSWEANLPSYAAAAITRPISDHMTLCLTSGEDHSGKKIFHFKKGWLEYKGVHELIRKSWTQLISTTDVVGSLSAKLKRLKKVL